MSPRPALFLDRDGVINLDHGYVATRERLGYVPGIARLVAAANHAGWAVVVVTNQSGVARGYFPESQMHAFHDLIRADLAREGARIDAVYHCPHLPGAPVAVFDRDCDCRKPRPGMLLRAIREMTLDPDASAMIGDKPSDVAAAQAAGVAGHLFEGGDVFDFAASRLPGLQKSGLSSSQRT